LTAFRTAHNRPVYPSPLASSPRQIYHTLNPHPALSPVPLETEPDSIIEQERNEEVWRQLLVQGVLAVLLPTEDLENGCLRSLVGEILSELILRAALSDRLSEGWMLWEILTRVLETTRERVTASASTGTTGSTGSSPAFEHDRGNGTRNDAVDSADSSMTGSGSNPGRLEQFGLLAAAVDEHSAQSGIGRGPGSAESRSAARLFWTSMHYGILAFTAARSLLVVIFALASSAALPPRSKTWPVAGTAFNTRTATTKSAGQASGSNLKAGMAHGHAHGQRRPLVSVAVWRAGARLIELDVRMPWFAGLLSLLHRGAVGGPGRVDGALDR